MKGELTVGQYRAIDLSLFALMLILSEKIIVTASTRWFPNEPYTVSVVAAVTAIVMMRWGYWAALHAALGGLVFCLASGAAARQYVIYCGGNLLGLAALAWIRAFGEERVRQDVFKSLLFGFSTLLLMQLGRGIIATDAVSYLFTLLIIWIVRRLDGVFEEQIHYLRRVRKQREEDKGGF